MAGVLLLGATLSFSLQSAAPGFVKSIKQLHIKSSQQRIINKTIFVFDGAVEVLVDQKYHLWADHVELDKTKGTLLANKTENGPVSLENKDFVILADQLFLDFTKKTGYADKISIHVDEGYLSASRAEKLNETDWSMNDMIYTPCDEEEPHWHFKAQRAMMHGSYLIKASNLIFKVGRLPLFILPRMVFPIQGSSKSGFLMPKFSYDYEFGLGAKQDYYWNINRHCDTTIGVDWREKRGIVFLDELRWARAMDNFTIANWWYAIVRKSFIQKKGEVCEATARRYWVSGKDFHSEDNVFGSGRFSSLARVDFGTDKRIGYTFGNSLDDVDDTFNNSWILRSLWSRDLVEMKIDNAKTNIKIFSDLTTEEHDRLKPVFDRQAIQDQHKAVQTFEKKEREDRVTVAYFPHVEWNCSHKDIGLGVHYRHDLFFDQILYRQQKNESFYFNSRLAAEEELMPLAKADLLRFCYKGNIHRSFRLCDNTFKLFMQPHMQLRSHVKQHEHYDKKNWESGIFGRGAYRLFLDYGAEWALPEFAVHNGDDSYQHSFQPTVQWEYIPKFYQDHWFYIDRRDRTYPKNELSLHVRNNISAGPIQSDLHLSQGVDFYKQQEIFYLRRGTSDSLMLPFRGEISFGGDPVVVSLGQEYDWKDKRILQSDVQTTFLFDKFHIGVGYLFQNRQAQLTRGLLSNIPHFLTLNLAVPLNKQATLLYDSQFYSEKGKHFASLSKIHPLLHRVRLDYNGHCWGFYFGFEQKKYREYGVDRSENTFVFSLRLDSLGSFAKKFRGIPTIKKTE